jgi:hypothetical protein
MEVQMVTRDAERVENPFKKLTLFAHQLAVSYAMVKLETETIGWSERCKETGAMHTFTGRSNFGVLADSVGAGKSYCALCTIQSHPTLNSPESELQRHRMAQFGSKHLEVRRVLDKRIADPINIIVVPHGGVYNQWVGYINNMINFTLVKISKQTELESFFEHISEDSLNTLSNVIILVSSTFYNKLAVKWPSTIMVSRLIFDEADSIRIPSCLEIPSAFTWFITSSMRNLCTPTGNSFNSDGISHVGFIRNVFRAIEFTDKRGFVFLKCDHSFVQSSLNLPQLETIDMVCKPEPYIGLLHTICSTEISNMLHGGDIAGAIGRLGCSSAQDETNLFEAVTNHIQRALKERLAKITYVQSLGLTRVECERRTAPLQNNVEHYRVQIETIRNRLDKANEEVCPICLDVAGSNGTLAAMKCCAQLFCLNCIQQSYINYNRRECFMCRRQFTLTDVIAINNAETNTPKSQEEFLTKMEQTIRIISNNPGGRFLIFSAYDQTFNNLTEKLREKGVTYAKLAGNSNQISSVLRKFTENNIRVLFLNANFFGQGYNLEQTTDVVIFHRMSEELTTQVIGRAQRLGRQTPLRVHNLLHPGE